MVYFFPIESLPREPFLETLVWWSHLDEDAPWVAAVVSHHWRSTVLSCSGVWSRVTINFDRLQTKDKIKEGSERCVEEESDYPRDQLHPLALWLARARGSELCVSIRIGHIAPLASALSAMVMHLQAHASQLKEFELRVFSSFLTDALLGMLWENITVPSLEHVTITCEEGHFVEALDLSELWCALEKAPAVKLLRCAGCLPRQTRSPPHCLSTLVLENFTSPGLETLLDILEACQSLVSLTVSNASVENFRPKSTQPPCERLTTLPALTSLTLDNYRSYKPGKLLAHLTTPKLCSLTLRHLIPPGLVDHWLAEGSGMTKATEKMTALGEVLETFFGRGTQIETLFWEFMHITDESFLRILEYLPDLSELHFKKSLIGRVAISGLFCPYDDLPPLCPKLQVLAFDSCDCVDANMLLSLLQSRSASESSSPMTAIISGCVMVHEVHVQTKLRKVDSQSTTISFRQ